MAKWKDFRSPEYILGGEIEVHYKDGNVLRGRINGFKVGRKLATFTTSGIVIVVNRGRREDIVKTNLLSFEFPKNENLIGNKGGRIQFDFPKTDNHSGGWAIIFTAKDPVVKNRSEHR